MKNEIKRCPFCGTEPETAYSEGNKTYGIRCDNDECPLEVGTWEWDTEAEAIAAWNRRERHRK